MLQEKEDISIAQILSEIKDKKQEEWFSKLVIASEREKNRTERSSDDDSVRLYEIFNILCKDIELDRLKKERKLLEKEVLLMTEGKIKNEPAKIKRYLQLTSEIKGSGKK